MAESKTKAQNARRAHEVASKTRANDVKSLKALYLANKDNPVVLDIIQHIKSFSAYHTKMGKDGVGYRNTGAVLENGQPEQEVVYYTSEKRVSEFDKSVGQDEIMDYINRQLDIPQ